MLAEPCPETAIHVNASHHASVHSRSWCVVLNPTLTLYLSYLSFFPSSLSIFPSRQELTRAFIPSHLVDSSRPAFFILHTSITGTAAEPLGYTQKPRQLSGTMKVVCSLCFPNEKRSTKNLRENFKCQSKFIPV